MEICALSGIFQRAYIGKRIHNYINTPLPFLHETLADFLCFYFIFFSQAMQIVGVQQWKEAEEQPSNRSLDVFYGTTMRWAWFPGYVPSGAVTYWNSNANRYDYPCVVSDCSAGYYSSSWGSLLLLHRWKQRTLHFWFPDFGEWSLLWITELVARFMGQCPIQLHQHLLRYKSIRW